MNLWEKGLTVAVGGVLLFFLSFAPGAGPCGPSTPIGMCMMLAGMCAVPVGVLILLVAIIKNFVAWPFAGAMAPSTFQANTDSISGSH